MLKEDIQKVLKDAANLSDANLSGVNLSDANLSGVNLSDANLFNADLESAKLYGFILKRKDEEVSMNETEKRHSS